MRASEHSNPTTIPAVLAGAAQGDPDGYAVVEGERRTTFAELDRLVDQAAAAYVAAGIAPGDRVAIWAQNGREWIVAAIAAQAAGAVIVTLNTRFKGEEARYILEKSGSRLLVTASRFLGVDYAALLSGFALPDLVRIVRIDTAEAQVGEWDAFLSAAGPGHVAEARARRAAVSPDDISDVMFTSGTTGNPKGVVTTHGQNVDVYRAWGRACALGPGGRYLVMWPFFHCAGYKSGWLASFIFGVTVYPMVQFDAEALVDLVEREAITMLPGPPTLFQTLLSMPGVRGRLGSVRVSMTGAASVAPSLITRMHEDLGFPVVLTAYGLTETCGTATLTDASDSSATVANTVGKAMPGVQIRIEGPDGVVRSTGEAGEVMINGYNVMQGYYGAPEETADVLTPDGWLRTGDVGFLDERGYLKITDRSKDLYITGGFNCYPAEIERIMGANPAYLQVAVIGVADERLGEVGKAFVVPRPGQAVTPESVIAYCRDHMANFKAPRYVEIVQALPTNATGKVQKFKLDRSPASKGVELAAS